MKRPSALARRDPPIDKARVLEDAKQRIRENVAKHGKVYSVEVAALLGIHVHAAANILRGMEIDGEFVSSLARASKSGLGRRYYTFSEGGR